MPPVNAEEVVRLNVVRLLRRHRISGAEFARAMDKSVSWASNFLTGKKSAPIDTLEAIARYLAVPIAELFDPAKAQQDDTSEPELNSGASLPMVPDGKLSPVPAEEDMPERTVAALFTLLPPEEREAVIVDLRSRVARSWGAVLPSAHPKDRAAR